MTVAGAALIKFLLALLGSFLLVVEIVLIPFIGCEIVNTFPETAPLFLPALIWSILVIGCAQAVLVIIWKLVSMAAKETIFTVGTVPLAHAIIAIFFLAFALLVTGFVIANVLTYTPPLFMYLLIGSSLLCLAFALLTRLFIREVRRATDLRDELAAVI